jgi:hypothetical protein
LLNIILACNGNDDGNDNLSKMCDDDELDDLKNGPAHRMLNDSDESCMFCWEFGRDGSDWVHAECSAAETSNNFVYDFCLKK